MGHGHQRLDPHRQPVHRLRRRLHLQARHGRRVDDVDRRHGCRDVDAALQRHGGADEDAVAPGLLHVPRADEDRGRPVLEDAVHQLHAPQEAGRRQGVGEPARPGSVPHERLPRAGRHVDADADHRAEPGRARRVPHLPMELRPAAARAAAAAAGTAAAGRGRLRGVRYGW